MRCVTYAGETLLTTDEVAEALVTLTAAIARYGQAEAVRIPIVVEESSDIGEADLVIGVGNDVLSAPADWDDEEPDFSAGAEQLRAHRYFPDGARTQSDDDGDATGPTAYDLDLDDYLDR